MKKIILIISLIASINSYAQNFDSIMIANKSLDCKDVAYNSALLFERYFTENQLDSAKSLLYYWKQKCGLREPVQRARLLLALKEENFRDTLLTKTPLRYIFDYQIRSRNMDTGYEHYDDREYSYDGYIPIGQSFDSFTKKEFENLKSNYTPDKIEYLLCEFYSDNPDTLFTKLQTGNYETSILQEKYDEALKNTLDMPETNLSLITGIWIPTGKLKTLGVHPEIGLQFGIKKNKMNYDLVIVAKFINSPNEYYTRRNSSSDWEKTNRFTGAYIGFEVGRDIYTHKAHEIQLIGGIAYDNITTINEDKDKNIKAINASSYNFNIGIGYRHYFSNSAYWGLRAKYNIVDYRLNHVIDFTGNPVSVQFTIGAIGSFDYYSKSDRLKRLKYKYRE